MAAESRNQLLPTAWRKGHREVVDEENRTGERSRMPKVWRRGGNVVFRCGNIRRVKDQSGRREWGIKEGMRWDSWDALATKKW